MAESVKSAERVLEVLALLTDRPQGLTFQEVRDALGLPKSSAHALLQTMTARDFLTLDPRTRRYTVGLRTWQAGQAYLAAVDLEHTSLPYLEAVRDVLDETVQLAVLDGTDNVYIAKVDSGQALVLASRVGVRLPAYTTGLGKALLSGLDDAEVRRRFEGLDFAQYTPRTVADVETLLTELATARTRGYATDRGEYTTGVSCVAVPVRDHTQGVCAAMSVSVPEVRMTAERRRLARAELSRQADALSWALGYRGPGQRVRCSTKS